VTAPVELALQGEREDVPRSRAFVQAALGAGGLTDDAELVVTELVTNAVLHGLPPVRVRVRESGGVVRLEVEDGGSDHPVRIRESTEAMTGRGLALVAAVSRRWGVEPIPDASGKCVWAELAQGAPTEPEAVEDVDLDALLASFADDEPAEQLFTVELGAVPTDLLLDAKAHIDNLVREFTLEAAVADDTVHLAGGTVPLRLARLVATVVHGFAPARGAIKRQAIAAAQRAEREVRLSLTLPASAADAGEQYLAALDEADEWARDARLLTLETPAVHKVFRRWYVQTLVDQLRAASTGGPTPQPVSFPERVAEELARVAAGEGGTGGRVDHRRLFHALPTPYMVMDRDLRIVEANEAYLANVGRTRQELLGRPVFEMFPPTPDALDETGVTRVQRSFERARDTGLVDTMPLQRYSIPDPATGQLVERFWSLISVPVAGPDGRVALIAQRAEDITAFVAERERGEAAAERSAELGRRVLEVEADLYARAQELESALAEKEQSARRVASLAGVALELTAADDVGALTRVVFSRGLPVLGADGGAIVVRDDERGTVRLVMSQELDDRVPLDYAELPLDHPVPGAHVARTGATVVLPTRETGLAWSPFMAEVYEVSGRDAWAVLPLRVGDRLLGALVASWVQERAFSRDDLALLEGFAAQVSQALQRIQATAAQRESALAVQRLSESLQRSLLTEPPDVPGLDIAVRYQPAAQEAQIGGDWYDAFVTRSGATLLVIGDIGGHDRTAAALMGQVRNLLRGMAFDSDDSPAVLLSRLDTAVQGLSLDTLATALLARVEPSPDDADRGVQLLRWSNAGHLPPVLRSADGSLRVLEDESDLLLGLDADTPRGERVTELRPGDTLVLFTDGLVERRDASIDDGVQRVLDAVAAHGGADAATTADAVVAAAGSSNEDDIAVLVLHAG
jgi:serine phosphatase RsbU (regulator of sigma subunit)/PAS domain-containing protein